MMLHVSDLLHLQRCPVLARKARQQRPPVFSRSFLIEPFSRIWKKRLHLEDAPETHVGDGNEVTLELLQHSDSVCQARLEYRGLRVRIPALIRKEDGSYTAWYPYLSAFPKENEAYGMKINMLVAEKNGIRITENHILYMNRDYIREGELDEQQMLLESDRLFNRKNRHNRPVQKLMGSLDLDLDALIDQAVQQLETPAEPTRCKACTAVNRCLYYEECFDDSELPDDSIYFLTTSRFKFEQADCNVETIGAVDPAGLEGTGLQYAQVMASRRQAPFLDRLQMRQWITQIRYPVSYLDFEWDTFAFPPYPGMKPHEPLCFQYSLHIEQPNGTLAHRDFFKTGDCRKAFIESLLGDLPVTGSILVYNMEGAEKLRLLQLARQFPEYQEQLEAVCGRMIDLSKPFENGIYYDSAQRGHYSLKQVLPLFSRDVSYHDLDVQNGLNAVAVFREYPFHSEQEQQEIRQSMKEYCGLDTLAEYLVFHGLEQALEDPE